MSTKFSLLSYLLVGLMLVSSFGYSPKPVLAALPQTPVFQPSSRQYVTVLPVASGNPSPLIIYPNDTTIWVAGFSTPARSQIREYFVDNGTSRGVLNFSNAEISALLVDRNRVWFAENSTLAFYNSTSGKTETQRTFPSQSIQTLALDHQDRLWMAVVGSSGASTIIMLTQDNATRTFIVPTSNALVYGMTVAPAPDDTIWFTETAARKLGKISCDTCSVEEFSPPLALNLASPTQIAADSSGNVWFTDHGANQFGMFNPSSNTWKILPIGYCQDSCTNGLPNAIFLGARNTIWFSEHIAGRVANYDPSIGILKEYVISPNSPPGVWWAMPGKDNLVWFVAWDLGEMGYVNSTMPVPFSLTAVSDDVVVQRGGYRHVSVQVIPQGPDKLSFGVSPVTNDQQSFSTTAQIFGSSPADLQLGTGVQTVNFDISAAWNATLGSRFVALTASDGQVAISVHVRVVVVEAAIPYISLGISSAIVLGTVTIYLRRPRTANPRNGKKKRR